MTEHNLQSVNSDEPEIGFGELKPLCKAEEVFNSLMHKLPYLSAILLMSIAVMMTIDLTGRFFFSTPWRGITDLETLFMSAVGFLAIVIPIITRESIQIDLFYDRFQPATKRMFYFFASAISFIVSLTVGYSAVLAGLEWTKQTGILEITEWPFCLFTGIALWLTSIAFFFQTLHALKRLIVLKEYKHLFFAVAMTIIIYILPFAYKASGLHISGLVIGGIGFVLLMVIMLVRVPLGFAMTVIGLLGLLAIMRRPEIAFEAVGSTAFVYTANFMLIALPMFMLMGEMVSLAGLSGDLFKAARMWFGRLPGGLAVASVGGCAGFGAVCGDSLATVITMSTVALPPMNESNYDKSLSTGALAAGGTLGILIPPSMGFIIYSMITEVSVGSLFIAGILPGLLLCSIFMIIIMVQVKRNPSLAPKCPPYPLKDKLASLVGIIPVVALFSIIIIGILDGWFTPAESGALGAVLSLIYAIFRGRITLKIFSKTMISSCIMFGKLFALFVGLYILGSFLAASRLPLLLATTIAELDVNRYVVLIAIIVLYILLGCVMNIMPMMMLTLPSIYPTVELLGFDGVWFGVVCVIVMEMGMITPPVGMNVFTLAGMHPEIPMPTIFRGVMPFFIGMLICIALIIMFPQIALFLVPTV